MAPSSKRASERRRSSPKQSLFIGDVYTHTIQTTTVMMENQNNPEKQYGGNESTFPPLQSAPVVEGWKEHTEGTQKTCSSNFSFVVRCDDCCLSVGDASNVVFCCVTHPTFIVRRSFRPSRAD